MSILTIISIIIVFLFLVSVISSIFTNQKTLNAYSDGKTSSVIKYDTLPNYEEGSTNFSYSIWFNIQDWSYKFGSEKILFSRGFVGCPAVTLGAVENNLQVSILTMSNGNTAGSTPFKCGVDNVPLQQWTNLIICVNGRSLDIYINGKLVRTCVMPGVPAINPKENIYLNPRGGFSGSTSNFKFWTSALNPQQAWNVYRSGPGGNMFASFLSKYKIQMNFMKGSDTVASVTI